VLDFAVDVAREAGRVLRRQLGRLGSADVSNKGRVDLVTAADREAEALIVERIRTTHPDHAIMAEESAPRAGAGGRRWIVDPLDGTTNFVHGYPLFAVSIAYEVDGRVEAGVVHAPMMNETFTAERDRGASLNGVPLRVSRTDRLIESLLATGFAYDRWSRSRNNLEEFARLTMSTQGVRRGGAASLDLAYVAAGRLDGYWEMGLKPWDVAAGALLVEEAGGCVTDLDGGADWRSGDEIIASNGPLHTEVVRAIAGH
jgi:myo-inositol-1(or 4)-monophosphatase